MGKAKIILGVFLIIGVYACKEETEDPIDDTFDKEAMLTNMANNVIIPAYAKWLTNTQSLNDAVESYLENPDETKLGAVRASFLKAYESSNHCAVYEFGPAADKSLRLKVNLFPVDTARIEEVIRTGDTDFGNAQNSEAVGFAALDYVLHNFTDELASSTKRQNYLKANVQWILDLAMDVTSDWNAYKADFISNTSSSAGSPLSNLVNQVNYEFELIKNARIGIPLGKKTLGETQSNKLEGYFSNTSATLAIASLNGVKTAFEGGDGLGLDDYLNDLDAKKDGASLDNSISTLFDEIAEDLQGQDLRNAIEKSPASLEPMYNKIEQLVVLLKADMPSQLGVQITYQDNDGD